MKTTTAEKIPTAEKLPAAVLNEYGLVDCRDCPAAGDCTHRDAFRRNPRTVGGLALCPRLNT